MKKTLKDSWKPQREPSKLILWGASVFLASLGCGKLCNGTLARLASATLHCAILYRVDRPTVFVCRLHFAYPCPETSDFELLQSHRTRKDAGARLSHDGAHRLAFALQRCARPGKGPPGMFLAQTTLMDQGFRQPCHAPRTSHGEMQRARS